MTWETLVSICLVILAIGNLTTLWVAVGATRKAEQALRLLTMGHL